MSKMIDVLSVLFFQEKNEAFDLDELETDNLKVSLVFVLAAVVIVVVAVIIVGSVKLNIFLFLSFDNMSP